MRYRVLVMTMAMSVGLGLWILARGTWAQPPKTVDEQDFSAELPRIAVKEPAEAAKQIQVKPGYRVELVASEPLTASPVAVAWDEDSRFYVVEMRGYSEHQGEGLSRIRRLEDTDGDGKYDQSIIFADKLSWATAVACWDGGIFVADAPHIYYLKDTNGDGQADIRDQVYTGFATSNVQGLLNSFHWTMDNRIHGSASTTGGRVGNLDLRGRDFSFEPKSREFRAETGGGQHGMSFDDWGRKYVCSNSDHLRQVMIEDRYLAANPYFSAPSATVSIAVDGPQAEVYRISPVEPWRIVRTRLRVSGAVKGIVEGGGRAAGYFTGATGVTIYRGDQCPDLLGLAFIGDVGSNLVHRKKLVLPAQGVEYSGVRIDEKSEFLASSDIWFRPAQFANGPDGCLHIIDVCREVIEHPASLPPEIKKHLDLDSGRDRGRIYRIVPTKFQAKPLPKLGKLATAELVDLLEHSNGWHRDTASRLIYQRQDMSVVNKLAQLAQTSKNPLGKIHALHALSGLGKLNAETLTLSMKDESPRVRERAVRLAESLYKTNPNLAKAAIELANDSDAQVRQQLALSLSMMTEDLASHGAAKLLVKDGADRWRRLGVLSSTAKNAGRVLIKVLEDASFRQSGSGRGVIGDLARLSAFEDQRDRVLPELIATANQLSRSKEDTVVALLVIRNLTEGLNKRGIKLSDVAGVSAGAANDALRGFLDESMRTASDQKRPESARVEALATLALAQFDDVRAVFAQALEARQPLAVRQAALDELRKRPESGVAQLILKSWSSLSPSLRLIATDALLNRSNRILVLFDAIERKELAATEIDPQRIQGLVDHREPKIRDRARILFAESRLQGRKDVIDAYKNALALKANPDRGKTLFAKVCATCHRVENVGHEIGPSLATIKNRGAEAILFNVLDPNREVNPQFVNYSILLNDGRTLTGMIASENASSITLKRAENQTDTVLKSDIDELRSTGQSIMPEGLEKQIDVQGMADLIAYLLLP